MNDGRGADEDGGRTKGRANRRGDRRTATSCNAYSIRLARTGPRTNACFITMAMANINIAPGDAHMPLDNPQKKPLVANNVPQKKYFPISSCHSFRFHYIFSVLTPHLHRPFNASVFLSMLLPALHTLSLSASPSGHGSRRVILCTPSSSSF
jgi:hypothetical protein